MKVALAGGGGAEGSRILFVRHGKPVYGGSTGTAVLAVSERSGVVLDEAGLHPVGFEPAYRFDRHGKSAAG